MTCRHTICPDGYVEWHEWAEKKSKHHVQVKCPNCGLWAIWRRRDFGVVIDVTELA